MSASSACAMLAACWYAPEVSGSLERVEVGVSIQDLYAMVKIRLVIVRKGLQLNVDGFIPAVFKTRPCIWPLMR